MKLTSRKRILALFMVFSGFVFTSNSVSGIPPVIIEEDTESFELSRYVEILEDKEKNWTIGKTVSPELESKYYSGRGKIPNFGFTSSAFWLKVRIENSLNEKRKWFLSLENPRTDTVEVYYLENGVISDVQKSGDTYPLDARIFRHRYHVFPFETHPNREKTIFLRLMSSSSMQIPLFIMSPAAFIQKDLEDQIIWGVILGVLAIIALYSFVLSVNIKKYSYIYWVFFVLSYILFQMSYHGFALVYLWPNWPRWNNVSGLFFIVWCVFWSVHFCDAVFRTKETYPRLHSLLPLSKASCALMLVFVFLSMYYDTASWRLLTSWFTAVFALFSCSMLVIIGILIQLRKHRLGKHFFLAFVGFSTGSIYLVLVEFGLLPVDLFIGKVVYFSSTLMIGIISMTVIDGIRKIRTEKYSLQNELFETKESMKRKLSKIDNEKKNNEKKVVEKDWLLEKRHMELKQTKERLASLKAFSLQTSMFKGVEDLVVTAFQYLSQERNITDAVLFHDDKMIRSTGENEPSIEMQYKKRMYDFDLSTAKEENDKLIFIPIEVVDNYLVALQSDRRFDRDDISYYRQFVAHIKNLRRDMIKFVGNERMLSDLHAISSRKHSLYFIKADYGYCVLFDEAENDVPNLNLSLRTIKHCFSYTDLLQVHRSYLVNTKKVRQVNQLSKYRFEISMGIHSVPVGRSYVPRLRHKFPKWFAVPN